MALQFDESKTIEFAKIAEKSQLSPVQEKLLKLITALLSKTIPSLSDMVIRGLFRMSVTDFVTETGIEAKELMEKPIAEVDHHIKHIFDIMGNKLTRILRRKEDVDLLKEKVNTTYELLIQKRVEMESQQN